jgi:glucans biosynthesis protein
MPTYPLAQVVATRTGLGGWARSARIFLALVVDFAGGDLAHARQGRRGGAGDYRFHADRSKFLPVRPLDIVRGYRVTFDLKPTDDSVTPVDLASIYTPMASL